MIKIHVLLVDDEKDVFSLFKYQFKKWINRGDVKLSFSESGEDALEFLETSNGADVILLFSDINMPGMDGFELLKEVKEKHSNVVSILISGYSKKTFAEKIEDVGLYDYFEKPVDFERLKQVIREKFNTLE